MPPDALPPSTLHLTETATTVHAQQCVHAASARPVSEAIIVALTGSPDRWLDQWQSTVDTHLERATFVISDDASWTAGHPRDNIETVAAPQTDVRVETIASPGNFTDIGVTLTDALDRHEGSRPILCFQSVTVLLQYAPLGETCRFLYTLVGHLDRSGATGHFHVHEGAHDEETIATLRSIHDRVRHDPA